MPELPEVETMRRGIHGVVGARITEVARTPCRLKPISILPRIDVFRRRAVGKKILDTGRVGKRVLLILEDDWRIVFEPRMTGLVLIADPPNIEHLRFQIDLKGTRIPHLWYWDRRGLGSVRLLSPQQFEQQLGPAKIGVDALAITVDQLQAALSSSRRAIKVALLDQRAIAGVGNLYASELLHLAEVHPETRCDRLSKEQWCHIHQAMLEILEEAIRCEGSTLSDGTYRNALNDAGGYQSHHQVYDREGAACPRCADQQGADQRDAEHLNPAQIRRIVQAQRSTFFCPKCQTKRQRKKT